MKKLLLATTILATSTGFAAAEVTVGGSAGMGVSYTEGAANEFAFVSNIEIEFTASGETDGGLSFGGSVIADEAVDGNAGTAGNVFISGAFGKISMGDVDGAAEFVVGDLDGVGYDGVGDYNENVYLSNARRPAARYEYSTGGLTFAFSADNPGLDGEVIEYGFAGGLLVIPAPTENTYALGVKYAVDNYAVALGYERSEINGHSVDHIIIGGEATFSGVTLKAVYGTADLTAAQDFDQAGVSATYTMDAVSVTGFYRQEEITGLPKASAIGLGASYDLGGGASVVGGISRGKISGIDSQNLADLGVTFTF